MVEVAGFMLPVDTNNGRVSSFLIHRSRIACCFGVMPEGNKVDYMNEIPVTVAGILNVGERNVVSGIYTLEVSRFSFQD